MWHDTVWTFFFSICMALLTEVATWMWLYRLEKHKSLIDEVVRRRQLIKKKKELCVRLENPEQLKEELIQEKEKLNEQILKLLNAGSIPLHLFGLIAWYITVVVHVSFKGQVIAKLPFVPFNFIQTWTHLDLPGDDPTDCSLSAFSSLCFSLVIEYNHKLLGLIPARRVSGDFEFSRNISEAPRKSPSPKKAQRSASSSPFGEIPLD